MPEMPVLGNFGVSDLIRTPACKYELNTSPQAIIGEQITIDPLQPCISLFIDAGFIGR